MTQLNIHFIYGFTIGFTIAEEADKEEFGMEWGFSIYVGIFSLTFAKYVEES